VSSLAEIDIVLRTPSTKERHMTVSRRRLLASLALTSDLSASAQSLSPDAGLDALRHVADSSGTHLSDDRLKILKPVLERRQAQLRTLRDFKLDDMVAPTQGTLDHGGF